MYSFFRPLLFRLDPETAQRITLQVLRSAGRLAPARWLLTRMYTAPAKPVQAFGRTFKNPVGLAAGFDKDGRAIAGLCALGFGHVEVGTVTPRPQPGNPRPRLFRLPEDKALINRLGFPSRGSEHLQKMLDPLGQQSLLAKLLARPNRPVNIRPADVILGVNLGKNGETPHEQAVLDYLELLQCFAPYADYLAINISSPNTVGLRKLQGPAALENLLTQLHLQRLHEVQTLSRHLPLLVKLAPDLSEPELDAAVDVILATGMDGLIVTNTTIEREGLRSPRGAEAGGLSGRPLGGRSETVLSRVVRRVDGRVPVVSTGGIMNPEDARRRLDLGATLIQVYTGLIYAGPSLVKNILMR